MRRSGDSYAKRCARTCDIGLPLGVRRVVAGEHGGGDEPDGRGRLLRPREPPKVFIPLAFSGASATTQRGRSECTLSCCLRCIGRRELKTSHDPGSWAQGSPRLRVRSYVKALRLSPLYLLPVPPPAAIRRPFYSLCRILCRLRQRSSAGHFFPMRRRRTLEAGNKGGALPCHPSILPCGRSSNRQQTARRCVPACCGLPHG